MEANKGLSIFQLWQAGQGNVAVRAGRRDPARPEDPRGPGSLLPANLHNPLLVNVTRIKLYAGKCNDLPGEWMK